MARLPPRAASLLLALLLPLAAQGAASKALGGGKYVPTTDVDYIVELTEQVEAIATETSIQDGQERYKQVPLPDGISLESISLEGTDTGMYLDWRTNPLYNVYMYAFWRGHNGSGAGGKGEARDAMKFLGGPVDAYAHIIVVDEFKKTSGYDPALTAEAVKVTNMWMAAVQSLYDAVELCDEAHGGGAGIVLDPVKLAQQGTFQSPVDQAAAFWYGDYEPGTGEEGSLYAWAAAIRAEFDFGTSPAPFDVNAEMDQELPRLQALLEECLAPGGSAAASGLDGKDHAMFMRRLVDGLVRAMTVPLAQSLIHHLGKAGTQQGGEDTTAVDYLILYALVTLPPIVICDKVAYDALYSAEVTTAKTITSDQAYNTLETFYSRLVCLGIDCDMIGESKLLAGASWPICAGPEADLKDGYPTTNDEQFLEFLKVDLDVRTIGTLVEMGAADAAYNVYQWGMHSDPGSYGPPASKPTTGMFSIKSAALEDYDPNNKVGQSLLSFFPGEDRFADRQTRDTIMGMGDFASATLRQRRIVAEATMVMMTMPAFAINSMYKATLSSVEGDGAYSLAYWDQAVASLSGWAERDEHAKGFLLMEVAQYLCEDVGDCNEAGDTSQLNDELMAALVDGKQNLIDKDGDAASLKVKVAEKLLMTALVDVVAFFAEIIDIDKSNADNLAEGYGAAVALLPLMKTVDPNAAATVEANMGIFPSDPATVFSKEEVFSALRSFATQADIDCTLLTREICSAPMSGDEEYPSKDPTNSPMATTPTSESPPISSYVDSEGTSSVDSEGTASEALAGGPFLLLFIALIMIFLFQVVARPGASTISSLSGNDDSTNSQLYSDSVAAETIAALESSGESTMLDVVGNAAATDADAMESDGDESGDRDGNDAPLIELIAMESDDDERGDGDGNDAPLIELC